MEVIVHSKCDPIMRRGKWYCSVCKEQLEFIVKDQHENRLGIFKKYYKKLNIKRTKIGFD
jgi:hypothetical protein